MVLSKDFKKAIVFGFIIGALVSFCSLCFASEVEDITPEVISNRNLSSDGNIYYSSSASLYYVEVDENYKYYILNDSNNAKNLGISNSIDTGTTVDELIVIQPHETYTYYGNSGYLFLSSSSAVVKFSRVKLDDLDGFVDDLALALSFDNLGEVIVFVVPILTISVLFGLGFFLGTRIMDKIKKAKGGV